MDDLSTDELVLEFDLARIVFAEEEEEEEEEEASYVVSLKDVTERKQAQDALQNSEERYRALFANMLNGFAYCKMIFDNQNRPVDFVYLAVNSAFEQLTGLKNVVGKRVSEVIPNVDKSSPELFERYARVALTGKPEQCEFDFEPLNLWLSISVYSTEKGYFGAVFENITERKRAEEDLHNLHNMLRELAENTERVREEEMSAIAREVHDEIGQILTALKMDVSSLVRAGFTDPSSVSKRSESMHSIIDHGIKAVQQLSAKLRPRVLDDLGLIAALEWQADDFQMRTGIHCSLHLPKREVEMEPQLATVIFRVFQEMMTNIARHSNARNVTIAFELRRQKLTLRIQDDGVGISRSKISDSSSFGLIGIRERLLPYRGRLGFEWPQEGGTLARITIPYPNKQGEE